MARQRCTPAAYLALRLTLELIAVLVATTATATTATPATLLRNCCCSRCCLFWLSCCYACCYNSIYNMTCLASAFASATGHVVLQIFRICDACALTEFNDTTHCAVEESATAAAVAAAIAAGAFLFALQLVSFRQLLQLPKLFRRDSFSL